jgi:CRISPR-associated protein Cmr6
MPRRAEQAALVLAMLGDKPAEHRKRLLDQRIDASRQAQRVYAMAFERWRKATEGFQHMELKVCDRLASGMGQDTVLEVGITLHHTYGTPILRGSALKGLAAHYCERVWGQADGSPYRAGGDFHRILFGSTTDSGFVTFHDGWITPASLGASHRKGLVMDVMTPHHGPYYMSDGLTAPTDFDDPNPVTFLSVAGSFYFVVENADTTADGVQWGAHAIELLKQALCSWGAGAKTSTGYGQFDGR